MAIQCTLPGHRATARPHMSCQANGAAQFSEASLMLKRRRIPTQTRRGGATLEQ